MTYSRRFIIVLLALVFAFPCAFAQGPSKPDGKPDYSKEAFVIEQDISKVTFENDGTGTRDATFRIRVQSDAGVQRYMSSVFLTGKRRDHRNRVCARHQAGWHSRADAGRKYPRYAFRGHAPSTFLQRPHEKHIAVKGLAAGDVLEAETRSHITKPLAPGQFWPAFNWTNDFIILHQEIQINVPRDRVIKWKSLLRRSP